MAKEYNDRASRSTDPKYYEPIKCEKCNTRNNLQIHSYNEEVICDDCVEDINIKLREAEEELEGYYTERSYLQLAQERNE